MSRRSKGRRARPQADPLPPNCQDFVDAAHPLCVGTALEEHGVRVAARDAGQRIRAYRLDSEQGRRWLQLSPDDRVADGAFAVLAPERRLLLVELKGEGIERAVSQLTATIEPVTERIRAHGCDDLINRILAAVVATGGAPPAHRALRERFFRQTGVRLEIKTGARRPVELRELFRLFDVDIDS